MGYIHHDLVYCTCNVAEGEYNPQTLTVIVTCASDYEFQIVPKIDWDYRSSSGRYFHGTYNMEKVDEYNYSYELEISSNLKYEYYIVAEAVKKSVVIDKYGLITIYRPTTDILKELSTKRFIKNTTTTEQTYFDTAAYMVSLMKLYVSLESDTQQKIYFGPFDMGIDCDVIGVDIITVDLGTVHIPEVYGNSIDYDKTEIVAYLPFIGFVTLDTADFMNKDVSLHYQVNVINGDALAVFTCDGNVMYSQSCNVSFKIPFRFEGMMTVETEIQPNTNYLLDVPATIYVKTHAAVDPNTNLPYHDTKFYSRFGDLSGYTEAQEIDFKVLSEHITKTEIDEIISLLENGVFL